MIALSDLCKLKFPGKHVYIHDITLHNKGYKDTIACTFHHDLSKLPVLQCEIGNDPVVIPIPDSLRSLWKHQWVYMELEAEGKSRKNAWDAPLEFCMSLYAEPREMSSE
jgi:hypothetical protein